MFNSTNMTAQSVTQRVQALLRNLHDALDDVQSLYYWSSGLSQADLTAIGFSAADASTILSAISDANAVSQIFRTGLPPATYPQPASAYPYMASQNQVVGP